MAMRKRSALATALCLGLVASVSAVTVPANALTTHTVESPDGDTTLTVRNEDDGTLTYSVTHRGIPVIDSSNMGVVTEAIDLSTGLSFVGQADEQVSQNYELVASVNGPVSSVANEMRLAYTREGVDFVVEVRAHDDGVAFRYLVDGVGPTAITDETTTFTFPADTGLWASDYREARDYEDSYPYVSAMGMDTRKFSMPLLGSLSNNAAWTLISEAAVYVNPTYPATRLDAQGNGNRTLKVQLPGPDNAVFDTNVDAVKVPTDGSFATPWRVILASTTLDSIVTTSMFTDLNPPVAEDLDTSWIRPGKALWSWWSNEENAAAGDDMRRSQKEYIDIAEQLGMEYITVDCCYNDSDGSVEELVDYGERRGIGVFVWKNRGDYTNPDGTYFSQQQLDDAMQAMAQRGVAGLKIDFMQSDRLDAMRLYDGIAQAAMAARLLVNFHGSTKPSGEDRTYPNIITTEAVLGSEQYKYGRPPTAVDSATYPFTRNPVGGMDQTPVIFSNSNLLTTHAHQLAQSVVFTSAMHHFADSAAAYETWVGRHLLTAVPTVWDESILLEGFPDDYATIARRSGSEWFVGSVADGARTATVPLSFLGSGSYVATLFADGDSDRDVVTEVFEVTAETVLSLPTRTHGGFALHIGTSPLPFHGANDRVFEAEDPDNVLAGNASLSSCPGCSGGAKVGNLFFGGTVTFTDVTVAEAGTYILRLGYTAEDQRGFTLSVNDGEDFTIDPPRSGRGNDGNPSGWDIVRNVDVPVELEAGANTVKVGSDSFAPDVDRIILLTPYEAEDAANALSGSASATACTSSECSGQQVRNINGPATLEFRQIQAYSTGSTTVHIRYASPSDRTLIVRVNGEDPMPVHFPATGGWDAMSTQTVHLELIEGQNVVTFGSGGGSSPMVDQLIVRQ